MWGSIFVGPLLYINSILPHDCTFFPLLQGCAWVYQGLVEYRVYPLLLKDNILKTKQSL